MGWEEKEKMRVVCCMRDKRRENGTYKVFGHERGTRSRKRTNLF